MENAVRAAIACGLGEIAFTDHYDEDYPDEDFTPPDFDAYFEKLREVRENHPEMQIRAAVELGMQRESNGKIRRKIAPYRFDFVLFSKHVVKGRDPWYDDFYADRSLREGERLYLREMLEDIRVWEDFDVVGHIGYADKYLEKYPVCPSPGRPMEYTDFPDELDAVFRELIGRGKGIELNTSTFLQWGEGMPRNSLLRRYAELGGEIVTIGSDAHSARRVGEGFLKALALLEDAGLKWVCTFEKRKPAFHALKNVST